VDNPIDFAQNAAPIFKGACMAEEIPAGGEQMQVQLMIDERDLRTTYINAFRFQVTNDEVILDIGFNMPNPNQNQGPNPNPGQQQILWKITDRVVMSYVNAKRLALSLGQLVKRYEQQFGEINTQRPMGPPIAPR
jgi:hypothetical protein